MLWRGLSLAPRATGTDPYGSLRPNVKFPEVRRASPEVGWLKFLGRQSSVVSLKSLVYNPRMSNLETSSMAASQKNPWVAFLLTLIFPGLGHFYVGNRFAALAYGAMTLGLGYSYFSAKSFLAQLAVLFIIPFVVIPAARDAVAVARGKKKLVNGEESRVYVFWMLCCVGPFAMPLLWQNKKLSITVKVVLSIIVISIAVIFLWAIAVLGKSYDQLVQTIQM